MLHLSLKTCEGRDHVSLAQPVSVAQLILHYFTYQNANVAQKLLIITTENKSVWRNGSYDPDSDVTVCVQRVSFAL